MPLFVLILLQVLRRQERTGERLLDALSSKATSQAFARHFARLFCAWDRLEQGRDGLAASPGQLIEHVAVEVERGSAATLRAGRPSVLPPACLRTYRR